MTSTQLGEDSDEALAAFSDEETEATYKSWRVIKIIDHMQSNLSVEDMGDNIKVRNLLSEAKNDFNMAHQRHEDFDYYILLCALFPPMRNIIKNWNSNEELFI